MVTVRRIVSVVLRKKYRIFERMFFVMVSDAPDQPGGPRDRPGIPRIVREDAQRRLEEGDFSEVKDYHRERLNLNIVKMKLDFSFEEVSWVRRDTSNIDIANLIVVYHPTDLDAVLYAFSGAVAIGVSDSEQDLQSILAFLRRRLLICMIILI